MAQQNDHNEKAYQEAVQKAQAGSLTKISDYFHHHGDCKHANKDRANMIRELVTTPEGYPRKADLIATIYQFPFDANKVFPLIEKNDPDFEQKLWDLHTKEPSEDTALAAAMLVAEYQRYRYIQDEKISLPLGELLVKGVSKDSIIAIQNALVTYVAESNAPITRGAGFLKVISDEKGAELWLQKLSAITTKNVYSLQSGDSTTFQPVFGGPSLT